MNTAWIISCKKQKNGHLINGHISVLNAPVNRHYAVVQEWIAEGNIPEPEFTDAEIAENEQRRINWEARAYLAETGWYVERYNDPSSGRPIPQDILDARAIARASVK